MLFSLSVNSHCLILFYFIYRHSFKIKTEFLTWYIQLNALNAKKKKPSNIIILRHFLAFLWPVSKPKLPPNENLFIAHQRLDVSAHCPMKTNPPAVIKVSLRPIELPRPSALKLMCFVLLHLRSINSGRRLSSAWGWYVTEHSHYVTLVLGLLALPVNSGLSDTHFEGSHCIPPQHVLGPCEAFHFFYLVSNFFYASLAMQKKNKGSMQSCTGNAAVCLTLWRHTCGQVTFIKGIAHKTMKIMHRQWCSVFLDHAKQAMCVLDL